MPNQADRSAPMVSQMSNTIRASPDGRAKGAVLEIGTGEENVDHVVRPENALRVAMGRQ